MNVRELIEELQKLDPELVVLKQKDDEGNGYSRVNGADDDCYVDNSEAGDYNIDDVMTLEDLDAWDAQVEDTTRFVVIF